MKILGSLLPIMAMACTTSSVTATSDSDKSVEHVVHLLKDILLAQNSLNSSIALPHAHDDEQGNRYTARLGEMEDGGIISASVSVAGSGIGGLRRVLKGRKGSSPSCSLGVATHFGWSNWFETVATLDTPVFRVKSDSELKKIVKKSASKGCRVRPMGTTHSADGLIIQRTDEDVVVVSLADYTTKDADWADRIDTETGKARFRAGMLFYEAVAISRPHGFVFRERSAIPLFTIGGVVANMVHGGSKSGGFVHSDVTKLLVMKSNGKVVEVEGDELQFWRSSAGQLGIILAAEFQLVSEENGGLVMSRNNTGPYLTLAPGTTPSPSDIQQLVAGVTGSIFQTIATKDHCQFFYDWYANTLNAYTSDFSGDPFDGEEPLRQQYQAAADFYLAEFGGNNAVFTGGLQKRIPVDDLCLLFCQEGTGPLSGTSTPCDPIESTLAPPELLCNIPVEVGAAFSLLQVEALNTQFDGRKSSVNDGYVVDGTLIVSGAHIFFPSRALPQVFGAWWAATAQAVGWATGQLSNPPPPFQYVPTSPLELRFINPSETAVMNPIPTFEEFKEEFDSDVGIPFDSFFPPGGIPDGLIAFEIVVLDGINDGDANKYLAFMEEVLKNIPSNPLAPYGPNPVGGYGDIVKECDVLSGVVPCAPITGGFGGAPGLDCCNPPIPVRNVHLGKGWGFGVDPETTPITGSPVPFQNQDTISSLFSSGSKASSVDDFNDKVDELDADVFAGGALLRWLRPDSGKGGFEPRKLVGQECGSPSYAADPDAECISGDCDEENSICVEVEVSAPSSSKSSKENMFG